MEKGKGVAMGRRWAVDFTDNSTTPSTRDIPDPPGFSRASPDQVRLCARVRVYVYIRCKHVCILV